MRHSEFTVNAWSKRAAASTPPDRRRAPQWHRQRFWAHTPPVSRKTVPLEPETRRERVMKCHKVSWNHYFIKNKHFYTYTALICRSYASRRCLDDENTATETATDCFLCFAHSGTQTRSRSLPTRPGTLLVSSVSISRCFQRSSGSGARSPFYHRAHQGHRIAVENRWKSHFKTRSTKIAIDRPGKTLSKTESQLQPPIGSGKNTKLELIEHAIRSWFSCLPTLLDEWKGELCQWLLRKSESSTWTAKQKLLNHVRK